jgi:anti-sigma-K factor RskA
MSQFERDLHKSLRRRDPPPGFAERVLARADSSDAHERAPWARFLSWRWVSAAAMVVVLILGFAVHQERKRSEEEKAKQQVLFAFRLTGSKLRHVQEKLAGIHQLRVEPFLE